jgi:hypothetical protein
MSSDATGASYDPFCAMTTYAYDSQLGSVIHQGGSVFDVQGRLIGSAGRAPHPAPLPPTAAAAPRTPLLRHTFEFRLSGSETQEQSLPLAEGSSSRPAGAILAIQSVRTYLTREGALAATSAIGGVEVDADLRPGGIFCTARLSDFGASDLVVVRVEVALY